MKFIKIQLPESNLVIPEDCYQRAGVNVCAQVYAKKNPVTLILPSLMGDLKMRFHFKVFVFDIERSAEENNITVKAVGDERINGASEIVLKTNGACVIVQPVGDKDWFCFTPSMPLEVEKKKVVSKKGEEEVAASAAK